MIEFVDAATPWQAEDRWATLERDAIHAERDAALADRYEV